MEIKAAFDPREPSMLKTYYIIEQFFMSTIF